MPANVILGAVTVTGRLSPAQLDIPSGTVVDDDVSASAAIDTNKVRHRYRKILNQPNSAATTETRAVHVVRGATGTIKEILAATIAACAGAATIVIDLKKNGSSVMSSTITLDNANTARVSEVGTLNPSLVGVVVGDLLEVVVTATAGGGTLGTGLLVQIEVDEDNA